MNIINGKDELNEKQIKLFEILKKQAQLQKTITYGEVSVQIYEHPFAGRALGYHAGQVSIYCMKNNLPAISAILCNRKTNLPGKGFDGMYNDFHKNDLSKHIIFENRSEQIHQIQKDIYKTDWR